MEDILQATHQNFPPTPHDTKAFLDAGVNRRATFFGCNWTPGDPVSPLLIYFPNSPPLNGDKSVTKSVKQLSLKSRQYLIILHSSNTFRLSYAVNHTRMFLDQAHANTIGGFVPGSNEPDARFGKCLQCAAIDRARTKDGLDIPRSPLCEECFAQYCYDERNPPNEKDLPNRDLEFFDPYPQGLSKVEGFLKRAKGRLIGGFIALLVGIAALIGGLYVTFFMVVEKLALNLELVYGGRNGRNAQLTSVSLCCMTMQTLLLGGSMEHMELSRPVHSAHGRLNLGRTR